MASGVTEMPIAEYNQVFGNDPDTVENYLCNIPRSMVLTVGSHFLGFKEPYKKRFDVLIPEILGKRNPTLATEIVNSLFRLEQKVRTPIAILNVVANLELFEYAFESLNAGEPNHGEKDIEERIIRAYLAINQQTRALESTIIPSTQHLDSKMRVFATYFTHNYHSSDLQNFNEEELLATQIVKAIYFFEFLESNNDYKSLLAEFLNYYSCKNWKHYIHRLLPIVTKYVLNDQDGLLDIIVPKNDDYDANIAFLDKLALADSELLQDYDYKRIRAKPLYRVDEGKYRLIFGLFLIEKIYKALFFKLSEINACQGDKQIKSLHGRFSDQFSEKVMVYTLMERIYGKRSYKQFTGNEMRAAGMDAEPDYYIRKGKRIFLFESKDFLIKAKEKTSYDFRILESELRKKFFVDGKQSKAIPQLIKNIERLLTYTFNVDKQYSACTAIIYPVIIVHDHQYNTLGLNSIINTWFQTELKKVEGKGLLIGNVRGLTIINIDTLIFHQDLFQTKTILMEDVLENYQELTTFDDKKKYKSDKDRNDAVLKSMLPFSVFINKMLSRKNLIKTPKMIREKGFTLFS